MNNEVYAQKHSVESATGNSVATAASDTAAAAANQQADHVIYVDNNYIDTYAMNAISVLSTAGTVTLRSKGRYIPTAVTIANIVTCEIMIKTSRVRKILLDTDSEPGIGHMTSTVEIQIDKK